MPIEWMLLFEIAYAVDQVYSMSAKYEREPGGLKWQEMTAMSVRHNIWPSSQLIGIFEKLGTEGEEFYGCGVKSAN